MDEHSRLLLTNIILLLILFSLCQLVSGGGFQSGSQVIANYELLKPFIHAPPYHRGASGSNSEPELREDEAKAITDIMSILELKIEPNVNQPIAINCTLFNKNELRITKIFMSGVSLTGQIADAMSILKYLKILDLSNNQLHGLIPYKLGELSNLITLDLSENQLTGKIPPSLGNLKNLKQLYLSENLFGGQIPASLGNLSSLLSLEFSETGLTGKLPRELGKLSNLQYLWLDSNNLEGKLPQEYENLTNLLEFSVGGNNLSGAIPGYIANWVNLTTLSLIGNNFDELSPEIFNLTNLEYLEVSDLKKPKLVLPESANFTNLNRLILRNCNIIGVIPSSIADWSPISAQIDLDLSFNKLIGEVPGGFKNLSFDKLFLTGNWLNGTFPVWIYETVRDVGDLAYNNFTFPDEMETDLGDNNFNFVPDQDEKNIKIEPRNREFAQQIMDKHCHGEKFKHHSLFINAGGEGVRIGRNDYEADNSTSHFYVSPALTWAYSCNGYFYTRETNSRDLLLKSNCGVSDTIEEASLYLNARLCPQSLIYYGLCLHNGNYTVKLHFSETQFSDDDDRSSSIKRVFDIYIQEKLKRKDFNIEEAAGGPNKIWTETFIVSVHDNLLKIELFWGGKGSIHSSTFLNGPLISAIAVYSNDKVGGLSNAAIVGIVIAAVAALLLLLALLWRMGWIGDRELRVNKVILRGKSYTIKQVKDATRNFSPRNEIGKGRFGIVYKAELTDGQIVAVKKLPRQSKHVIDQIGTEVYTLKQLKNENIVELLDGYSKGDLHLLIYEYMGKGSLQRALFDPNFNVQLDWPTRVRISLGIAKGLKYLHHDNNTSRKIVHRNIKPSNILLDENLRAKVADFGLAKIYDEENPYKFIQEKGTVVYMAPEYAMRKAITDKVDVFSFGIVLLEIVSGQTNANYDENQETVFLLDTAIVLHTKQRLFDLVDRNLPINRDVRKQAIEILELAMKCVDQSPTLRPTMSEIVSVLEKISTVDA